MKHMKNVRGRLRIRSLYIKWILIFICIMFMSSTLTMLISFRYIVTDAIANYNDKLYRKAKFIQNMNAQGMELDEGILEMIGDTDIKFSIVDDLNLPEDIGVYSRIISLEMLKRAADGEIVTSYSQESLYKMPFCLVNIGERIALLTPYVRGNDVTSMIGGLQSALVISTGLSSCFVVVMLIVVIRPIKKVSAAAREVAAGNFDVQLHSKSFDEVGELINNFNLMTAELQKNEYLKKDFISSVSHEFKTPITSIEGFARLLKDKEITLEQQSEYADIIIKEAARLSNMSSSLLKLSILDARGFEPTKTLFSLDEQLREVILLLQNQWEEKRVELDLELDEVMFNGNEELLKQVWINITQNAIKFSPYGGTVGILLRKEENAITVSVSDEGPGIPEEHGEKIFERFYKADRARSKEGSGLGLSIVKRIVELSKGTVSYAPRPGGGTVFSVTLINSFQNGAAAILKNQ